LLWCTLWLNPDHLAVGRSCPRTYGSSLFLQMIWVAASPAHADPSGRVTSVEPFQVPWRATKLDSQSEAVSRNPKPVVLEFGIAFHFARYGLGDVDPAKIWPVRNGEKMAFEIDVLLCGDRL
jgi:hypothetical protein